MLLTIFRQFSNLNCSHRTKVQLDLRLVMCDNFHTDMGWDSLIADDGMEIHLCVSVCDIWQWISLFLQFFFANFCCCYFWGGENNSTPSKKKLLRTTKRSLPNARRAMNLLSFCNQNKVNLFQLNEVPWLSEAYIYIWWHSISIQFNYILRFILLRRMPCNLHICIMC